MKKHEQEKSKLDSQKKLELGLDIIEDIEEVEIIETDNFCTCTSSNPITDK